MGKQSALIYFNRDDHKEIVLNGKYHDYIYSGSKLLWRKLTHEAELLTAYSKYAKIVKQDTDINAYETSAGTKTSVSEYGIVPNLTFGSISFKSSQTYTQYGGTYKGHAVFVPKKLTASSALEFYKGTSCKYYKATLFLDSLNSSGNKETITSNVTFSFYNVFYSRKIVEFGDYFFLCCPNNMSYSYSTSGSQTYGSAVLIYGYISDAGVVLLHGLTYDLAGGYIDMWSCNGKLFGVKKSGTNIVLSELSFTDKELTEVKTVIESSPTSLSDNGYIISSVGNYLIIFLDTHTYIYDTQSDTLSDLGEEDSIITYDDKYKIEYVEEIGKYIALRVQANRMIMEIYYSDDLVNWKKSSVMIANSFNSGSDSVSSVCVDSNYLYCTIYHSGYGEYRLYKITLSADDFV